MVKIDIAMATYNGANFIEEQIISIKRQTYENWNLYISDDNSSDDTLAIINRIIVNDDRIMLINTERKGGVISNFNCVLEATVSDYIVLCDQDDIWPENRLEILLKEINREEVFSPKEPVMVFSDLILIDKYGKKLSNSFYESNSFNPMQNLIIENLVWISTIYGCTTIMNRKLLDISLPIPKYAQMHDQWLALNALKHGKLHFLNQKTILYRQHDNNVVGAKQKGLIGKIVRFKKNLSVINRNAESTILMLSNHDFIFNNKIKLYNFAFNFVLPKVFIGKNKIHSLFYFILFCYIAGKNRA